MTRRELALGSFWTERPLVSLYLATTGAAAFSLRQLIAFAEALPDATFRSLQTSEAALRRRRLGPPRPQGDRFRSKRSERDNRTSVITRRPAS